MVHGYSHQTVQKKYLSTHDNTHHNHISKHTELNMRTIFPLLLRMLVDKRVPLKLKLIPVLAVFYVLLPFDFIPDLIPILGWIDDLVFVAVAILAFLAYGSSSRLKENTDPSNKSYHGKDGRNNVVDGKYRLLDEEEIP